MRYRSAAMSLWQRKLRKKPFIKRWQNWIALTESVRYLFGCARLQRTATYPCAERINIWILMPIWICTKTMEASKTGTLTKKQRLQFIRFYTRWMSRTKKSSPSGHLGNYRSNKLQSFLEKPKPGQESLITEQDCGLRRN